MSQFKNQFSVQINKTYPIIDYQLITNACRTLNGNALKIYIYFCSYMSGEIINFSPREISNELNISLNGTRKGFFELINNHYLQSINNDLFLFSDVQKM